MGNTRDCIIDTGAQVFLMDPTHSAQVSYLCYVRKHNHREESLESVQGLTLVVVQVGQIEFKKKQFWASGFNGQLARLCN